jgi:multimeric flavodoxin WrbA
MKILGLLGSPRENGNTATLLRAMCDAAASNGHSVEIVNIAKMDIRGCLSCEACKTDRVEYCALKDGMQALYPKLLEANTLIFATPVYMAQVSAQVKAFLDRWYAFLDADHKVRRILGRRAVVITTSGAPWFVFRGTSKYLKFLLRFFKLRVAKSLVAGSMRGSSADQRPALLRRARRIGAAL